MCVWEGRGKGGGFLSRLNAARERRTAGEGEDGETGCGGGVYIHFRGLCVHQGHDQKTPGDSTHLRTITYCRFRSTQRSDRVGRHKPHKRSRRRPPRRLSEPQGNPHDPPRPRPRLLHLRSFSSSAANASHLRNGVGVCAGQPAVRGIPGPPLCRGRTLLSATSKHALIWGSNDPAAQARKSVTYLRQVGHSRSSARPSGCRRVAVLVRLALP